MLLSAEVDSLDAQDPGRFRNAWWGVMLVGLLWGLGLCGAWGGGAMIFGDFEGLLIMPAMVTLTMTVLVPGRRGIIALSELAGRSRASQSLLRSLVLVVFALCLVVMRSNPHYAEYPLPAWIDWIRPHWKPFRVLLLMPLWGGWAMLIATRFNRLSPDAHQAVVAFARGCGPVHAACCLVLPLAGSLFYFHYLKIHQQLSVAFLPVVVAVVGGCMICRRTGLDRRQLLAVNLLTQSAFLLGFLANK